MGLQIGDIVPRKEISFEELKGKTLAVDAFNVIYQFISTIRQPDGTPLMDSKKRVTSHLSGLFYRNLNLLLEGIKLVYVFDGKAPELKGRTHELRQEMKDVASEKYEKAKDEEDIESMGRYAKQMTRLTSEMIVESKELLEAMGIVVVQAPSEGEAQASYICKRGDVYAVASQDYDCLVFETPKLIQNLTLARKRKISSGSYVEIKPQLIETKEVLKELELDKEQLLCLAILSGTDYNPGGVKGIGPKKALKLVKEHKTPEKIFGALDVLVMSGKYNVEFDWREIYELLKNPKVDEKYKIIFPKMSFSKIKKILMEHDFSEERIDSQLSKLAWLIEEKKQRTLF